MDAQTRTFDAARPRLQRIAYRMLGSVAEAEEVVQDAWLRWNDRPTDALDTPEAWLVTVTTRLAIDRLRAAKVAREHYPGIWLPEPEVADPDTPESLVERADDLSVAFLAVLERLGPEARAAYLMREVFDADYAEVAAMLGKSEAACRQLVSRAKTQLRDERPRYVVPAESQRRLLGLFVEAVESGDFAALEGMLDEQAELVGDGGGKASAFAHPLVGGRRLAQLFYAQHRRFGADLRLEIALVNGQWGLLHWEGERLLTVHAIESDGSRIVRIHAQRNPDKLARIEAARRDHPAPVTTDGARTS
jgi:RNA polymerase sigma-70 factor (TIGR02957 family)